MNSRRQATPPNSRRPQKEEQPVTLERIERAMVICARVIELDGEKYLPMWVRLEKEHALLKEKEDALARARAFSEAHGHRFPDLFSKQSADPSENAADTARLAVDDA